MIEIKNLSISFGEKLVIKDLSFSFKKGFNAIMGPSGSGKTSVAGAILGIVPYTGMVISDSDKYAAVFQEDRLCESISVLKNLKLVCRDVSVIESGLLKFNMKEEINSKISSLSGGMKRRVAILRALISDHDNLILDEPFNGLDEGMKETVMNYIKEKASDKTVILITHNSSEAAFFNCNVLHLNL